MCLTTCGMSCLGCPCENALHIKSLYWGITAWLVVVHPTLESCVYTSVLSLPGRFDNKEWANCCSFLYYNKTTWSFTMVRHSFWNRLPYILRNELLISMLLFCKQLKTLLLSRGLGEEALCKFVEETLCKFALIITMQAQWTWLSGLLQSCGHFCSLDNVSILNCGTYFWGTLWEVY